MVVGDERPTTEVTFNDPFSEATQGYIKSMDITLSTTLKADTEIAVGFIPTGQGNNFNNYVILTGSDNWTVPAGVTRIHKILVGAGNGGHGGYNGADGKDDYTYEGEGGVGGIGGDSGLGGLIYSSNGTVTPGASIPYSSGVGGTGGARASAGTSGTNTTFGSDSSASGRAYPVGLFEPKSGLTVGANGNAGLNGGNGNSYRETDGTNVVYNGITYVPGKNGAVLNEHGGGSGGGPAAGSDGFPGEDSHGSYGDGGNGANAVAGADATNYGQGGEGGHGGGGGGGCGYSDCVPGRGGLGSAAGKAADGCVIIYY
jgi:hypothetical protein